MDSICAAISYAELKRLNGQPGRYRRAARATPTSASISCSAIGVEAPLLSTISRPRVSDVMESRVISVRADSPVYDALQLIDQKRLRGLAVVDENNCCSACSAVHGQPPYVPAREEASSTRVTASLADISTTFGGALVNVSLSAQPEEQFLMVGAMAQDSFFPASRVSRPQLSCSSSATARISRKWPSTRASTHRWSTGGLRIAKKFAPRRAPRASRLSVRPTTPPPSVLLARGAVRVGTHGRSDHRSFQPDTLLETPATSQPAAPPSFSGDSMSTARSSASSRNPTSSGDSAATHLVDHNELTQAVRGADKVPIIEILDITKLGGFSSDTPISFGTPGRSTSSIVRCATCNWASASRRKSPACSWPASSRTRSSSSNSCDCSRFGSRWIRSSNSD